MNFKEAYQLLEIPENSSTDDAKKAFKKLAAKYHPDVNKEAGAEDKFKKINEAWQVINSGKSTDPVPPTYGRYYQNSPIDFIDLNDFISSFVDGMPTNRHNFKNFNQSNIEIHQTISFKESVLGCTRDIKYHRNVKCGTCQARGEKTINNGCTQCNGTGKIKSFASFSVVIQTCPSCKGNISYEKCNDCSGQGIINTEQSGTVKIPPKIMEGNILNLSNQGNYIGDLMGTANYTSLLLHIHVIAQDGLSLRNNDVVSQINITLLEALTGCKKKISTIDGEKEIEIPKLTKHKDEISIPKLGVKRVGSQIVITNIEYPNDVNPLIEALKGK